MSSSSELQGKSGNKAEEMPIKDTVNSSSSQSIFCFNNLPTDQQSSTLHEMKMQCEPSTSLNSLSSACKPLASTMKENNISNCSTSDPKPGCSNPSAPKNQEFNKIAENHSTRVRLQPLKEFALNPLDIPFTREKIAESLSLEEACGFLPFLDKSRRDDLNGLEQDLYQDLEELQKALNDAKHICIKLEKEQKKVSDNKDDLIVQADKLMYLLSSSSRIFEKLDTFGTILKEGIINYSRQAEDYNSSLDTLLEHVLEGIYFKHWGERESL